MREVQRVYLLLMSLQTLASSFIWGVNTLFLLDAGLTNFEAFAANAFFTVGMVLFEIPTGVVADTYGRRLSYMLGTITLFLSTLVYMYLWRVHATFWPWAAASMFLGLGFTFFSGAVDAWLVDALTDEGFFNAGGKLERVFGRGQIAIGAATLIGSVAGGYIAQSSNLGMPYLIRSGLLILNFIAAYVFMKDQGWKKSEHSTFRSILKVSLTKGLGDRRLRWMMLTSIFLNGVMIYVFYAFQPYLLNLYGDRHAYGIAGLAAAIVAVAQMIGGASVSLISRWVPRKTTVLLVATLVGSLLLAGLWVTPTFAVAIVLLILWALVFAVMTPVRQAFLNGLIESGERATLLSFDSVLGEAGSSVSQPIFGRVADIHGYPASFACSALLQICALPFIWLARKENHT